MSHAQNDRCSSHPEIGGARLPRNGSAPPCPGWPRRSMLCVVMEPASIAAQPSVHRSRRRGAAGPRPPTRPRGTIPRRRLVRRLSEARAHPFVLLVAPAGYGKTTLLSEWAACDGRRFAWIDLGAHNRDPDRLLGSIRRSAARRAASHRGRVGQRAPGRHARRPYRARRCRKLDAARFPDCAGLSVRAESPRGQLASASADPRASHRRPGDDSSEACDLLTPPAGSREQRGGHADATDRGVARGSLPGGAIIAGPARHGRVLSRALRVTTGWLPTTSATS